MPITDRFELCSQAVKDCDALYQAAETLREVLERLSHAAQRLEAAAPQAGCSRVHDTAQAALLAMREKEIVTHSLTYRRVFKSVWETINQ
jgi:hypothetical protein